MTVPEVLQEFMQAGGVGAEALRAGDEVALVFDRHLRVRFVPLPGGEVVLESRVRALPGEERERERVLRRAMQLAAGRMRDHADALVIGPDAAALRLQSRVAAGSSRRDLEARLEAHLNALASWRAALS